MDSHPRVDPNQQKLPLLEERLLLWGMFRQLTEAAGYSQRSTYRSKV